MSLPLNVNGVVYPFPEPLDLDWGNDVTAWASAVTDGMLQKAGGTFTLTAEVDFGISFGLKSLYYKSRTANVASAGQIRLARADVINFRNEANSADLSLGVNASNQLTFEGDPVGAVDSVSDTSTIDMTLSSGDLSAAIKSGSIDNSLISNSAAIAFSKLEALTAGNLLVGNLSNQAASVAMNGEANMDSNGSILLDNDAVIGKVITGYVSGPGTVMATDTILEAIQKLNGNIALAVPALNNGLIFVGNASNVATGVSMTGDIAITNTGVTSYNGIVPINKGGTGQSGQSAAFNALSPITTTGDLIYSSSGTTNSRLAIGNTGQSLRVISGVPAWGYSAFRSVTTTDSPTLADFTLYCSGGSFTITLPTAVGCQGKEFEIVFGGTFGQVITIATTSSQTIGGVASGSYLLVTPGEVLRVKSNNANWIIPYHFTATAPVSYTPTFSAGFGTPTGVDFKWSRNGKYCLISGRATCGTVTSATLTQTLPGTLVLDSSVGASLVQFGIMAISGLTSDNQFVIGVSASNTLNFSEQSTSTGGLTAGGGTTVLGNTNSFSYSISFPIETFQP